MDRLQLWERAGAHTEALVVMKSKQLIGKAGLTPEDLLDIRQDLRIAVWRSLGRYDAQRGPLEAHINVVVDSAVKMLLRDRRRRKRGGGRRPLSLEDGGWIADKARQILSGEGAAERQARIATIREACADLPSELVEMAVMRASMSASAVSRLTGRTPRQVNGAIARIRDHLRQRGVNEDF